VIATPANKLARLCAYSAQAPEWEQFVRVVTPVIVLSARRIGEVWADPSPATVLEIVQEVFVKLCEDDRRILREFEDRGPDSFLKLIRLVTASVGTDHFRRVRAEKRGGKNQSITTGASAVFVEIPDAKATDAVELPSLMAQLDGLLRLYPEKVSSRDRSLFWLHYRQGMPAEAISRIPSIGLSPKGVESALLRLTRLLRDTVINGKPKQRFSARKLQILAKEKGFSAAIPINNVKRQ
jgi:RNA polymerase sigma-70 factor (ECF subfamily)